MISAALRRQLRGWRGGLHASLDSTLRWISDL